MDVARYGGQMHFGVTMMMKELIVEDAGLRLSRALVKLKRKIQFGCVFDAD